MSSLPAVGYISTASRKSGEQKVALELVRDCVSEMAGAGAETTLTIASGSVTPLIQTSRFFSIEGQGGVSDDFTNVVLTNVPDGAILYFRCEDPTHVITFKHAFGGDGQFTTLDAQDLVMNAATQVVVAKRTGLVIEILGMLNFLSGATHQVKVVPRTTGVVLKYEDQGSLITNAGASGDITITLPAAVAGVVFEFATIEAYKLKVQAVGDDVVQDVQGGGGDSAAAGYIQSSAAKGDTLRLVAAGSDRWLVMSKGGTWTIDS